LKYRRKVTEVEAWFWDRNACDDAPTWANAATEFGPQSGWITCKTKSGDIHVNEPCWLIRELDGVGCYPCKTEIFEATYEAIDG